MNLKEKNSFYFIGIGGIGMSALARHFKAQGKRVSGYDKTETKLTKQLVEEGIGVTYDDSIDALPAEVKANQSDVLVVYTPAIPANHIGKNYLSSITNIDNIVFEQSISLFHDINNLFIIFIDKTTDTVFNSQHNPMIRTNKQSTKKVYINSYGFSSNKRRTKRNLFKEIV